MQPANHCSVPQLWTLLLALHDLDLVPEGDVLEDQARAGS
jgi:hypothetical protein